MFANLDREEFIKLLEQLGSQDDAEALNAARDLHAKLTVANLSWDDVLIPEDGDEEDYDDEDFEDEEAESYEEEAVEASAVDDEDDDDQDISDEEKSEALDLITKLEAMDVSADTKSDLEEYRQDIQAGEFAPMDLRYLRAFHKRLSK